MQQLQYEASWNKALSAHDRCLIEKIFNETKGQKTSGVLFIPIRKSINYKNELLVTVLVHNFTDTILTFHNTRLVYSTHEKVVAEKEFTLPALTILPNVSMPWTFIFSKNDYKQEALNNENGQLQFNDR
ncbi:SLAP domain-containing protein [Lysinibacillus telephonicus]|uniref:SLAP domain-containing protein n=1 Tax=Lysinibacillus telephonicus TaxID=1714840 RepID=UPI0031FBB4C4